MVVTVGARAAPARGAVAARGRKAGCRGVGVNVNTGTKAALRCLSPRARSADRISREGGCRGCGVVAAVDEGKEEASTSITEAERLVGDRPSGDRAVGESPSTATAARSTGSNGEGTGKRKKSEASRGQVTAILSGVVAVALGVGYLLLATFLDSREMLPPPPEAMMM